MTLPCYATSAQIDIAPRLLRDAHIDIGQARATDYDTTRHRHE